LADIRSPPHSLEAEKAALGAVLISQHALDSLGHLAVDDFFSVQHREIFEAMRHLAGAGHPVELVLLEEELRARGILAKLQGGAAYLITCANACATSEHASHYGRIVAEKAQLRRMIALCADVSSRAYGDADPQELLATLRERTGDIETQTPGGPVRVGDQVHEVIHRMESRGENPEGSLVPTGIKSVDEKLAGFRSNELVVVAANPGRGKTAFAFNMAVRAAMQQKIPTLVFSLEMSADQLIERALAGEARVNGRHVSLGRMTMDQWKKVGDAGYRLDVDDEKRQVPLYVDDRKLTASRICAEARRWRARHPEPRALIVIDYLGLVRPDRDEKNREREIAKMSAMFKCLSHRTEADCPVIMISQLNRENMKGKDGKPRAPVLSDLRESGAVEQDADAVLFPWWDSDPPAFGRWPARLIIGKFRNSAKGEAKMDWWPEYTLFTDPADPDDEVQGQLPIDEPSRDHW